MTDVRCIVDNGTLLGECPLWSPEEQVLYWIDIDGKALHRYNPATEVNESRQLTTRPGSVALTKTPGVLLVATEHQLGLFDWNEDRFDPWVSLEEAGTRNRLNDGRCDPKGRFVVGSMWEEADASHTTGLLHQVDGNGAARTLRSEIGISNGIAFDPARDRFYFADSPTGTIWVYDYDADTGAAANERVFFRYGDVTGAPDGGCVDSEGYYWSASVFGWAVTRISPDGKVDRQIGLPIQTPTMPAFGGPDMSTLFVTSLSYGEAKDGHVAGSLLAIETEFTGQPDAKFAR